MGGIFLWVFFLTSAVSYVIMKVIRRILCQRLVPELFVHYAERMLRNISSRATSELADAQ